MTATTTATPTPRTGFTALALRLVPGATSQPNPLAMRRLITGLTVVVISILLQTVPSALRAQHVAPVVVRFSWLLLEMLVLTITLSMTYDSMQRRRASMLRTLLVTLGVAVIVATAFVATFNLLLMPLYPELRHDGPPRRLVFSVAFGLIVGILHMGVWALAFVFPYVAEDARRRAVEADKLRIEAAQLKSAAELARLRSQLEPHFLLNTLNAIAGLVTENPREARRLIACLGDLLRDSLADADDLQPLEDEVAWLRRYAEILESRHAGTLSFSWEIEPDAKRALVPRLLLQPLVENAVKHGALRRRAKGGHVTIAARTEEIVGSDGNNGNGNGNGSRTKKKKVICTIEDNGPGLPDTEPRAGAFGLRSVRRRLELKFPDAVLRMESSNEGTRSIVELPSMTTATTTTSAGAAATRGTTKEAAS